MRLRWMMTAVIAITLLGSRGPSHQEEAIMKGLTPVLYVEAIEPVLPFWESLGFEKNLEVKEGDRLGFASVKNGPVEIMYQTRESVANDVPALADSPMGGTFLFIEVEDLDAVAQGLGDTEYVIPRRKTFYGAEEIVVREPGGNIVTFAYMGGAGD